MHQKPTDNLWTSQVVQRPQEAGKEAAKISSRKQSLKALRGAPVDFNLGRFQGQLLEGPDPRGANLK